MSSPGDFDISKVGRLLLDRNRPLKERFRALFTLKNLGGPEAIDYMSRAFENEPSALLKHEVAYCLGQMKDIRAIPVLKNILEDNSREPIVRHEAGEALGAIGDEPGVLELLKKFRNDPVPEVSDTCKLAAARVEWLRNKEEECNNNNPYFSVDPAPPSTDTNNESLKRTLLDESLPLFERYRAMFSLRNKGDSEAVLVLTEGLKSSNALFRHEVAFVLGQMQNEMSKDSLLRCLRDKEEHPMVRHECAEALGSLATSDVNEELKKFLEDSEPDLVRESCIVALDVSDYNQSSEFQYANALSVK